jgi:hypothetical protein
MSIKFYQQYIHSTLSLTVFGNILFQIEILVYYIYILLVYHIVMGFHEGITTWTLCTLKWTRNAMHDRFHMAYFNIRNSPQVSCHSHWERQQTLQHVHHQNSKSIFFAVTSDLLRQTYWKKETNIMQDAAHNYFHQTPSIS